MPGIYGYIKRDEKDNYLNNMSKNLMYQNYFKKDENFNDRNIEASHIHLGKMKKNTDFFFKKGIYISIEGEQYDSNYISFENLLFDSYKEQKLKSTLNKLDGYFNAVIYDSNIKKVFLISDRYGMRMLYYYFNKGHFAWSGEVKGLLGIDFLDKSIDKKQIECFMDLGYLLEDNTLHKHINLIKPSTIMTFDIESAELTQEYYWKWSEIKQQNIPFDDAVDKLGILFLNAVGKRFNQNEKIGISLSGGLDSRAIFAAVNKLYPIFNGYAYTFGVKGCDDIEIAKQCIANTNWKHKIFHFSNNNWFELRKEKVWFSDGMLNIMHMHGSEFGSEVSKIIDFNLSGYAGDVVLGGGWFDKLPLNKRASKHNLKIFYKNYIDICNIEDDFYNLNHCEPHLYMNRVRRFTNMGTVNGLYNLNLRKPFFDNKLIEFIYSISDEYRKNNKLYSTMLLKFFPDFFKDIPWQRTGITIDKEISNNLPAKIMRKSKSILYKLKVLKNKKYFIDYQELIKEKRVSKYLNQILNLRNSCFSKYTNENYKDMYLLQHLNNNENYSDKILRAATIELYLKKVTIESSTDNKPEV